MSTTTSNSSWSSGSSWRPRSRRRSSASTDNIHRSTRPSHSASIRQIILGASLLALAVLTQDRNLNTINGYSTHSSSSSSTLSPSTASSSTCSPSIWWRTLNPIIGANAAAVVVVSSPSTSTSTSFSSVKTVSIGAAGKLVAGRHGGHLDDDDDDDDDIDDDADDADDEEEEKDDEEEEHEDDHSSSMHDTMKAITEVDMDGEFSGHDGDDHSAHDHPHAHDAHAAGGGHVHHSAHYVPLEYLNESNIIRWHGPDPLSLLHWDWSFASDDERQMFLRTGKSELGDVSKEVATMGDDELAEWQATQRVATQSGYILEHAGDGTSHRLLLIAHVLCMCIAFFGALPIAIALKAAGYRNVGVMLGVRVVYASMAVLGWVTGWLYKELSPDLYRGQKHGFSSNLLLLSALGVSALDLIAMARRLGTFWRLDRNDRDWPSFRDIVLFGGRQHVHTAGGEEYERILLNEMDHEDSAVAVEEPTSWLPSSSAPPPPRPSVFRIDSSSSETSTLHHVHFADRHRRTERADSGHSETSTLRDSPTGSNEQLDKQLKTLEPGPHSPTPPPPISAIGKLVKYTTHFFERSLVIWAFIEFCWGVVIYTGMARGNYLPGLLAHYIKGAIFFWYGVLTFARYLGAWAEYGWAWNRRPQRNARSLVPTAEMVECFVIWLYGATNTWMERFGAAPGSPYSVKQVQHISIAVMFGGAGLIGMALEARWVRRLLSSTVFSKTSTNSEHVKEPRSYAASFNPFPALVIGVLGIAMSAHMQDYVFQVQVHALWGYLLAGFGLFRLLTYFFLYVAPTNDSVLPSRPPTEAMAAILLSCGGVVFVLSDEEVTFAAMRHGWDDLMAFMNVTFAFVCMVFSWVLIVLTVKGWATRRSVPRLQEPQQQQATKTSRMGDGEEWEDA